MYFDIRKCSFNVVENAPFDISRINGMSYYIFFYFSSQVIIKTSNGDLVCAPGTCILYEPHVYQCFYVKNNRLNHDYIEFSSKVPTFFKDIKFPVNKPLYFKNTEKITELVHQIIEEEKGIKIGNIYKYDMLMLELFLYISRTYHSKKTYSNEIYTENLKTEFEKIRLEIYKSPELLNVSSIAKKTGYSLARFTELYKKFFGCTPIADLTEAKKMCVKLLLKDNLKTKEIIKTLGFSGEIYFYRWFKQNFNMTLNEYKEKIKNED